MPHQIFIKIRSLLLVAIYFIHAVARKSDLKHAVLVQYIIMKTRSLHAIVTYLICSEARDISQKRVVALH